MDELSAVCPFEWRYGSEDMRRLFTVESLVGTYVSVERALVKGLAEAGLAPKHCPEALEECSKNLKASEVYSREVALGHEIAALTYVLGERCGECGSYVHLGATSYDVVDTAWALLIREALRIVRRKLRLVLEELVDLSMKYKDVLMVGRTHGQHAVPMTAGFKFANYVYELSRSYERLCGLEGRVVRAKISGAVGTMAAWGARGLYVEKVVSSELNLEPHVIATQVAPRDGFGELISALAVLASQLDRFALEVRELSRTEIGEVFEAGPRVGSSTMPHKRNPVIAERVSGLAKVMRSLIVVALENIPLMHERDLTNSSSERFLVPHAFLTMDQMLEDFLKLLKVMQVDPQAARRNLELTKDVIMSEAVVIRLVMKGMPRHEAHGKLVELIRGMRRGESLKEAVLRDATLSKMLSSEELDEVLKPENYLGCYRELIERTAKYCRDVLERCQDT
ncbi:MAG: adenylosuccinate lyase [Zestosphaera sp.]